MLCPQLTSKTHLPFQALAARFTGAGHQELRNISTAWRKLKWLNQKALGREPAWKTSCSSMHIKEENQFLQKGAESRNLPKSTALGEPEGMMNLTELLELKTYG